MSKIVPFLWFNGQAEEATNFYVSLFPSAKVVSVNRAGPNGPVISTVFDLEGQRFYTLNGGPQYSFSPAVSFFINCETQAEIDRLWAQLAAGGQEQGCGWVTDKFGLTWQVIPSQLGSLLQDPATGQQVMKAMLQMKKLEIAGLERAAGRP